MNVKVITASAGSGKTYRLSELLDEALTNGEARPEFIIATTFTKKAAAELTERARTRLLDGGNTKAAHALLAARIGTVNSVCGSIVSDFAFELGLSPSLQVIDEDGADIELRRALSSVVSADQRDHMDRLNRHFCKETNWQHEVCNIISAARANDLSSWGIRDCGERSIAELDDCMGPVGDGSLLDAALASAIEAALQQIDLDEDTTQGTKTYVEFLGKVGRKMRRRRMTWGDWSKLASSGPRVKSTHHAEPVQEAAAAHIGHSRLREHMHEFISQMFTIAADGLEVYQDHKRKVGVVDFVDQEALALSLLRNDQVREQLRGQIDLVLVDEFQDTSPLQLAIFLELAALAKQSVWVGDPKQAIFGFRGTDPALMDTAVGALTSVNMDPDLVSQATGSVDPQIETLSTSYRSRPTLVASTSEVFAKAFTKHGIPEERTRLTAHLQDEEDGLGAEYEYWCLDATNAPKRASSVAAGVRDMLTEKRSVRDKATGALRRIEPGDVAVLCRTNQQCSEVAEALVGLGLKPVLPSVGLFDTAEGQLVVAGLRLWVDPRDAVAAATIARLLVYPNALNTLVDRAFDVKGTAAFAEIREIAGLLEHRKVAKAIGLADVFDAVLRLLRARHWCACWGDSEQRLANLDAIRNHLKTFENQASSRGQARTTVGFLQHIEELLNDFGWQNKRTDAKALVGGAEAITVSTWHRSKGLEWPAVVLFGLESLRTPTPYGVNVISEADEFDVANPLAGRWIRFWPNVYTTKNQNGPVRVAMEETSRFAELVRKTDREALRVLYVGWTRARDQLVFAVQAKKFEKGLLGKLTQIDNSLISEPALGATSVSWAGCNAPITTRSYAETLPLPQRPSPGSVTAARKTKTYSPARQSPSSAVAIPSEIVREVNLGKRFKVRDGSDMALVGDAVHAFLAADRKSYEMNERLAIASQLLTGYGVEGSIAPADVVAASDRLWGWLDENHSDGTVLREWPLRHRLASGTTSAGTADLLVKCSEGIVVIDHKSFPGSDAHAKAMSYSGQLNAYANAVQASTGQAVLSTWIHFPVLGLMTEVSLLQSEQAL
mgnify:CR=1 FL=1|tara:strand:+ start:36256 stop:39447 length:3192 start_codon:yes stop_codon:yes gene_type:complete